MPQPKTYSYALSNGKTLDLEGDTQPSDAEVEAIAKEHGVNLVQETPPPAPKPSVPSQSYGQDVLSAGKGFAEGLGPGALKGLYRLPQNLLDAGKLAASVMMPGAAHLAFGEDTPDIGKIVRGIPGAVKSGYEAVTNPQPVDKEPTSETSGRNVGRFIGEQAIPFMLGTEEARHPLKTVTRLNTTANRAATAGMNAIENNPVLAAGTGAAVGGLVYPGGVRGAVEGALGGGIMGRALRLGAKAAPEAAEEGVGGLSAADVAALKKQGYSDELIRRIGSSAGKTTTPITPSTRVVDSSARSPLLTPNAPDHWGSIADRARANVMADTRGLPPGKSPIIAGPRPMSDDPSFVRGVPAQLAQSERLGLPPYKEPIITPAPADTSGITVTRAQKTKLPVRDPATGRMKRVYTSESSGAEPVSTTTSTPPLAQKVQALSAKGLGAEDIAQQLKSDPALKDLSRTERINAVREARGGQAGQLPARAKQAIDDALAKMKTSDQKRAYLMKAPNGAVYDYVKGKIGL